MEKAVNELKECISESSSVHVEYNTEYETDATRQVVRQQHVVAKLSATNKTDSVVFRRLCSSDKPGKKFSS